MERAGTPINEGDRGFGFSLDMDDVDAFVGLQESDALELLMHKMEEGPVHRPRPLKAQESPREELRRELDRLRTVETQLRHDLESEKELTEQLKGDRAKVRRDKMTAIFKVDPPLASISATLTCNHSILTFTHSILPPAHCTGL